MSNNNDSLPSMKSNEELIGRNPNFPPKNEMKNKKEEENSKGSKNGFVEYIIHPQKLDTLIEKIDSLAETNSTIAKKIAEFAESNNAIAEKIDNYTKSNTVLSTDLKKAIDIMVQSNDNQNKTLSLLSSLVASLTKSKENNN